jgi:hypothetical protein
LGGYIKYSAEGSIYTWFQGGKGNSIIVVPTGDNLAGAETISVRPLQRGVLSGATLNFQQFPVEVIQNASINSTTLLTQPLINDVSYADNEDYIVSNIEEFPTLVSGSKIRVGTLFYAYPQITIENSQGSEEIGTEDDAVIGGEKKGDIE